MHTGTVLMAEISTGQCLSTTQHDYQTGLFRKRERENQLVTRSWMNNFPFFYGDQLLFSGFTDSLPLTFLIHACCDFYQTTFGLKMSHLRRGKKSTGEEKAIKMMWLSHHAACCPLSLHHQSFPFPLAMMLFLCHPM